MNYSERTYEELLRERGRLESEYNDIESECLKDKLLFSEFCERAHDVKEKLFFIEKYIRLKKEPVITYGKEWNGRFLSIEKFKNECESELIKDDDGIGYYATESSKSDIKILPSDIKFNLIRNDFPYVIWFGK